MSSNFNCSYMAMSSLTYVRSFCVKFFFQPIYTDYANYEYFNKRSHLNLFLWNRWTKFNQTWWGELHIWNQDCKKPKKVSGQSFIFLQINIFRQKLGGGGAKVYGCPPPAPGSSTECVPGLKVEWRNVK